MKKIIFGILILLFTTTCFAAKFASSYKGCRKLATKHKLLMTGGTDFHGLYNDKVISIGDYGTPDDALSKLMGYKAKQKRLLKKAQKLAEEKAAENA